jgi:hypothetical protein
MEPAPVVEPAPVIEAAPVVRHAGLAVVTVRGHGTILPPHPNRRRGASITLPINDRTRRSRQPGRHPDRPGYARPSRTSTSLVLTLRAPGADCTTLPHEGLDRVPDAEKEAGTVITTKAARSRPAPRAPRT